MKRNLAIVAIAAIMILAFAITVVVIPQSTIQLDSVEVKEYHGQKLSSVNDSVKIQSKVPICEQ